MQARVVNVLRDIWCGNRDKTLRYRYSPPPANFLFFFSPTAKAMARVVGP